MSGYRLDRNQGSDIRYVDAGDGEEQQWGGYPGYKGNYGNSNVSQEEKRMTQSRPDFEGEAENRGIARGFISAISNVSGVSEDGYKSKYLKSLKELNSVLQANKKVKAQNESIKRQLNQINRLRDDPRSSLIESQLEQLRSINQKLEQKIIEILDSNKEFEDEANKDRDNLRKQIEKSRQLSWKIEEKQQQMNSLKDGHSREVENLNDTIHQLENANTAFKNQQFNLKEMYGGKQQANIKKIGYLETQLQETKAQLARQRQKINTEIQGMSIRIRKQTQTELTTYKLEMTKLKDANVEYQRQIERLNKQLRQLTDRRAEKKNFEHRHINQLQENVQNCKKQIRRLKQTLSNTHSIQIHKQSLEKQVKILQNSLHTLTQESAQAKARANSLVSSNEEFSSNNIKLEAEIKKLKAEIQRLDAQLKRKQTVINRQKNQSDTLKNKVVKLELDNDRNQGAVSRGNINDLQDRIRQLKNKVNLLGVGQNMFQQDKQEIQKERIQAISSMTSALQQKMDTILNENIELNKRLQHYKQKCAALQKKMDSSSSQNKILSSKVQKYEAFVPKLENQLQKAIKQAQYAQTSNTTQYLNPSQSLLKDKLRQMNDRLVLESKYAKQQLETKCLQYDSKLVSAKLQINKLKQALKGQSFFHNRITDLSQKLSDSENKKLQLMVKVGDLERYKILAERNPSLANQKEQSKNITQNNSRKELQSLRQIVVSKDKQIMRLKGSSSAAGYGGYYHEYQRRGNQFQTEIQELNERISQLANENNFLIRSKQQVEYKNVQLENIIQNLKQSHFTANNIENYQMYEPNDLPFDEINKLRQQSSILKDLQKSYFQLQQKNSIMLKTFEQIKIKYEAAIQENIRLKQQNQMYRKRQMEHQTQVDSAQQMFDVIHKRLEESLYQNSELISQNNRLKGITVVQIQQPVPSIGLYGSYGKMMSQEEPKTTYVVHQQHYDSSPETEVIRVAEQNKKKQYQKEFENAFFGSKKDSDASYEYETDLKGDGGFGEYY